MSSLATFTLTTSSWNSVCLPEIVAGADAFGVCRSAKTELWFCIILPTI